MTAKNTKMSVATATVALITGLLVTLLLALMPAPAKAQSGDVLRLLSIKAVDITNDEGPFDSFDEPYIKVDGAQVWSGSMKNGDIVNLSGVSATLSGANADVQLWERDPGFFNSPDDFLGEFFAEFTGGDERTQTINFRNGEAVYQIRYVVDRPAPNTPPTINSVRPAPGSATRDRTPLISAVVRDAQTELTRNNIVSLKVDGRAKAFSYDPATDRLTYQNGRLALGRHTVSVVATDGALSANKTWSFRVVKG